jgi:hypothetical protein
LLRVGLAGIHVQRLLVVVDGLFEILGAIAKRVLLERIGQFAL